MRARASAAACVLLVVLACSGTSSSTSAPSELDGGAPPPPPASVPPPAPPPPAGACTVTRSDILGSEIFCGNVRLYADDSTLPPWKGTPNGDPAVANVGGRAVCQAAGPVADRARAVQNVELRGWVTIGYGALCHDENNVEAEYFIDLALDLDWTPDPPAAGEPPRVRVRTLDDVLATMPGTNIIKFGTRQLAGSNGDWAGGGPTQAVVHVEVDGWGPTRGAASWTKWGAPPGWSACGTEYGGGTVYHSDRILPDGTRTLNGGEYVSVIGTLWHDSTHLSASDPTDPLWCWANQVTGGDYWLEVHTADSVRVLTPPTDRTREDLVAYASCSMSSTLSLHDVLPLDPPAGAPNATVAAVVPAIWSKSAGVAATPQVSGRSVTFDIQGSGATLAYYRVIWSSCMPSCAGRCGGTDGCGKPCPASACPATQTCDAEGACACPSGSTPCPDTCLPLPM